MDGENYRIGIVGCAGTGKSTLAQELATDLGVPFLESKSITQDILDRDGYDYASGIQIERFLAHGARQREILRRTVGQQDGGGSFVTDRTMIDLAAYAISELHVSDTVQLRKMYETCRDNSDLYTHIFVCPWKDTPVPDNQRRTLNPWYQFQIHGLELGLLHQWGLFYHIIESEGDDRLKEIRFELGATVA